MSLMGRSRYFDPLSIREIVLETSLVPIEFRAAVADAKSMLASAAASAALSGMYGQRSYVPALSPAEVKRRLAAWEDNPALPPAEAQRRRAAWARARHTLNIILRRSR